MKSFNLFTLALLSSVQFLFAQATSPSPSASPAASPSASPGETSSSVSQIVVTSQTLDQSRNQIVPSLGATSYNVGADALDSQAEGENAPFNQTILRLPGVVQDSFGQLHVRGEHADLQYRLDGVLIPEGISGFGQELETRFADNVSLITGALPAQYGFRTTGIIDITTKDGAVFGGGEVSTLVGSYDTVMPSFEYGGVAGKLNYYLTGSYLHNGIGIENPTPSASPIHDDTDQYKGFGYFSYIIDDSSRLTLLTSGNDSTFQIPNNPGQTPAFVDNGRTTFDSAKLNDNQDETSGYAIVSYQKKADDFNLEASVVSRYSSVLFRPDEVGDLIFNGVASRVDRSLFSNGLQVDSSYKLNDQNTLRGGFIVTAEHAAVGTSTLVFPVGPDGLQSSDIPERIVQDTSKDGYFYGVYLEDEWKPIDHLTINLGARFDVADAFINENQLSPRLNIVYQLTKDTSLHAGYARYFTPPPLESVSEGTVAKFAGTTNASAITQDSPVKAERAHYFDIGASHTLAPGWTASLDGFYKTARDTLDEGQFGQALILSSFNYARGQIFGGEFSTSYTHGPFTAYLNAATETALGNNIVSSQFLFSPEELAYIRNHYVYLDHDQRYTVSTGLSYSWKDWKVSTDLLSGSGLRRGFANTRKLPSYETVNLGLERTIKLPKYGPLILRLDVINLFDEVYELRDGSGIGVGAPQYGQRRGFYGTVSCDF